MESGALSGLLATAQLREQQRVSLGEAQRLVEPAERSAKIYPTVVGRLTDVPDYVMTGMTGTVREPDYVMTGMTGTVIVEVKAFAVGKEVFYASAPIEQSDVGIVAQRSGIQGRGIPAELTSLRPRTGFVYRLTGAVKALAKLRDIWGVTDEHMKTLLGYPRVEDWVAVLGGVQPLDRTVDRRERVGLLLSIDRLLFGLWRDDEAVQKWLKHPNDDLDGAPIAFMLRGKLRNLYVVADYIQGLTDQSPTK